MQNSRSASCRICNCQLATGAGQAVPEDLPAFVGFPSRSFACPKCYRWCCDFIVAYQVARANYGAIGQQIACLPMTLVPFIQGGQPTQMSTQAAAWATVYQTIQSAGLACADVAIAILDHLVIKQPRNFQDFQIVIRIAKTKGAQYV